jgi:hypothetical protein
MSIGIVHIMWVDSLPVRLTIQKASRDKGLDAIMGQSSMGQSSTGHVPGVCR